MKIAGIIAEYNPFHAGHAYHIAETRARTDCDYVVVCMAGSWTQRGEAACLSKWERAEMALRCGADAVFELPTLFAMRTADVFARGGVAILGKLGVDVLSFGSEKADLSLLEGLAAVRDCEPEAVTARIREKLSAGMAHARAWGEAVAEWMGVSPELINAPNAILGAEYIRAIRGLGVGMRPFAIERRGNYHGESLEASGYASATAIREAIRSGRMDEAARHVPESARTILMSAAPMHAPDDLLLHRLRGMSESELAALPDVAEGLEKRLARCAQEADSRETLIEMLKCKRYTYARLSRLCAHALLGLTRELAERYPLPEYARLIGMRDDARPLLKALKARSALPIVSDAVKLADNEVFQLDVRATDLRALMCNAPEERRAGQEFTRKFVRV